MLEHGFNHDMMTLTDVLVLGKPTLAASISVSIPSKSFRGAEIHGIIILAHSPFIVAIVVSFLLAKEIVCFQNHRPRF